jgi:flavorubredoxin
MSYAPVTPTVRVEPTEIAADTFVIHQVQEALGAPLFVYLNSMVIRGAEPVIVDTGTVANRSQWLDDVFGLVEPRDVRWIFLSHDDVDHTGNLGEVLDACPNATLVSSWSILERNSNFFEFPLSRCRWVNDGESFDVGDRTLRAVRPPQWDSPTTRGLFDERTGAYWGVDAFACPMPGAPVADAAAFDEGFWAEGMAMFVHNALSPWLGLVDPVRYGALCDRIEALGMSVIATAHCPVIRGPSISEAFRLARELPSVPAPPLPDQVVLESVLAAVAPDTTDPRGASPSPVP